MSADALRVAVIGATGTLGRELLGVLEDARLPLAELRAIATDRSIGAAIDFLGEVVPVESTIGSLKGLALAILCTPPGVALEAVREALRSEVACIDCSGVLVASNDVPLVVADLGAHDRVSGAPVITMPSGAALSWSLVLDAIQREVGIVRASGTVLQSASAAGQRGIDSLSEETLALLNQRSAPESDVFPAGVAFDCFAHPGGESAEGGAGASDSLVAGGIKSALARLLGPEVVVSVSAVQVPAFAGEGSVIDVCPQSPVEPARVAELLDAASGVDRWDGDLGPSLRDAVGRDEVLVGPIRADDGGGNTPHIGLWLAADPVRLVAANAVKVARARFGLL